MGGVESVYTNGWICISAFRSSLTEVKKRLSFFFLFLTFLYILGTFAVYFFDILSATPVDSTTGNGPDRKSVV